MRSVIWDPALVLNPDPETGIIFRIPRILHKNIESFFNYVQNFLIFSPHNFLTIKVFVGVD
jgi:ABC-type Na+ transport system ATPase subunit NatA